jgi:hypothetical protein
MLLCRLLLEELDALSAPGQGNFHTFLTKRPFGETGARRPRGRPPANPCRPGRCKDRNFPDESGCFHEASGCFPEASGCFHEASGCLPEASGCFHAASGCLPEASGCFHAASGCLPEASGCFHAASRCFPEASGCFPDACGRLPAHPVADSAGEIAGTDQAVRIFSGPGGRCARARPHHPPRHCEEAQPTRQSSSILSPFPSALTS